MPAHPRPKRWPLTLTAVVFAMVGALMFAVAWNNWHQVRLQSAWQRTRGTVVDTRIQPVMHGAVAIIRVRVTTPRGTDDHEIAWGRARYDGGRWRSRADTPPAGSSIALRYDRDDPRVVGLDPPHAPVVGFFVGWGVAVFALAGLTAFAGRRRE